jgi:hypothetical protein
MVAARPGMCCPGRAASLSVGRCRNTVGWAKGLEGTAVAPQILLIEHLDLQPGDTFVNSFLTLT